MSNNGDTDRKHPLQCNLKRRFDIRGVVVLVNDMVKKKNKLPSNAI